jgi:hypothetical protein
MAISIDQLAAEITRTLRTYTKDVTEGLETAKLKVAKETVKRLRSTSPKLTGSYARGWRVKKVGTAQVVHNQTDYQLTHLLEKGHAKVGGGRVAPRVHIRPAEQEAIKEYLKEAEKVIRG